MYVSDSSLPAFDDEELAVAVDLVRPGVPGPSAIGDALTGVDPLTATVSIWLIRPSPIGSGYEDPVPTADIQVAAKRILDDVGVVLPALETAFLTNAAPFSQCSSAFLESLTSIPAQGGLAGWVIRLQVGL